MNNNLGLRNSTDTVISKNEMEKKDSLGEPPPPPPPRLKSKKTTEIITTREGLKFKNGIELFDKNSIKKELEKSINTKPDSKINESEAQEYTNSQSRFSTPLENVSFDERNQTLNNLNKFEALNSNKVKDLVTNKLHDACSSRNKELVEFLIESGADVNYINKEGHTPLMIACQKGDSKTAKLLIKNGARVDFQFQKNSTALMHAINSKNIDLINLILKNTKNIDFENNDGDTALIIAVQNGDSKIASLLIEAGAHIDQLTSTGESALSVACECNLAEMLDFLIGKLGHFARNENNFLSHYPLSTIIENGDAEVMSVLLKNGLLINALKEESWRLIANASFHGKTEIARMLLEKCSASLPLSPPGFLSKTPIPVYELLQRSLKSASGAGNKEIVRMLIEAGAKLDHINSEGESATHFAIKKERSEVLLFLLQRTGKLTYKQENGKMSNELLFALDRPEPDSLIVDILLDFENDASLKQGGVAYTVKFNELCNKFHNLLARSRIEKIDQAVMRDLTASLCTDFSLTYVVAKTLVEKIQYVKEIYSPDNPTFAAPTAKQLRMIFVESVAGDQRLQDLIRYDDQPTHKLYANYQEAPDIAEKLVRRAAPQAGFIVMEAETELKEQQATLGEFLTKITPAITSQTVRRFMREEGWHPLMVELVADSWESLKQIQTSARLFQTIRDKFGATEFVDKVEQLPSDAARHLLTQQMNRLTEIINA
jgi:ankyrin repeat protein